MRFLNFTVIYQQKLDPKQKQKRKPPKSINLMTMQSKEMLQA